jgi:predicted FMN-binding regulatory protein PaiB
MSTSGQLLLRARRARVGQPVIGEMLERGHIQRAAQQRVVGVDGLDGSVEVDQPPYGRMLPGIRGLRLEVTDVLAKFKYDDHKPTEYRATVADKLTARGQGLDVPTARQQQRRLDRIGTWKPSDP